MADSDEGPRRVALLTDLELLNHELEQMGVRPMVSSEPAALYPVDELPALITATRRHLRKMAADLGGL